MQRYLYIILFFLVLLTPFVLRLAVTRGTAAPVAGRDARRLVVVTPHNQDIRREFARAFNQWHIEHYGEPVLIDYRVPGGTNDIKRMLENTYRAQLRPDATFSPALVADIHVVWGGGDYFFGEELNKLFEVQGRRFGILQPLELDRQLLREAFPQEALAGVKLYDVRRDDAGNLLPPRWVGVCLSSFGIVYNPDLFRALELPSPQTWRDLTHERLAGMLALADPTHSASAAVAYMMVLQRAMADAEEQFLAEHGSLPGNEMKTHAAHHAAIADGWRRGMGQLLLIAANARYFTASSSQVPSDVGHGEAAAGLAIDFYGRVFQETVGSDRIRFVSPAAATAINPDPVAILHGVQGKPLATATRFVEFLLTPQAQRLWILKPGHPDGPTDRSLRRPPIRRDVYTDRTGWADDVDPFAEAGGFNQRSEWMVLFTDTRPLWAAAWIDSRDVLKDSYATIRRVRDDRLRAQLIAELADLPITMDDVAQLREQRKQREAAGDVDEWRARQRIAFANACRAHYRAVAAKAR
jgi:iron(III) transport system substrate-binding protein